jgi:predicted GIY-YIG superfamily endonuclease
LRQPRQIGPRHRAADIGVRPVERAEAGRLIGGNFHPGDATISSFPRKRESTDRFDAFLCIYLGQLPERYAVYRHDRQSREARLGTSNGSVAGFTRKYGVKTLVWYELHESRDTAFQRERQLKKWKRAWKIELIERVNPNWSDLASELI